MIIKREFSVIFVIILMLRLRCFCFFDDIVGDLFEEFDKVFLSGLGICMLGLGVGVVGG